MNIAKRVGPALLLIDFQKGFDNIEYWGGHRNNPKAEENAKELLDLWRANGLPVFHIKHCSPNQASPLNEANAGNHFKDSLIPMSYEHAINKKVHSAFIGTNLKELLERARITILVMAGLTTDHCISTSARMAENLGFDTFVISDATATFDKKGLQGQVYPAELIHDTALASLNQEFAKIVSTDFLKWRIALNDFNFGMPPAATIIKDKAWVADAVDIHQNKLLAS